MENRNLFDLKTDLADESDELSQISREEYPGLHRSVSRIEGTTVIRLQVTDEQGERLCGKKVGEYVTAEVGNTVLYDTGGFEKLCGVCAELISRFFDRLLPGQGEKSFLLAGLGNPAILADAVGAETVRNFIVTRHIKTSAPGLFEKFGFRETAAVIPDVFGNTGIEAAEIIKGVVEDIHPDCVIAVDALSSRRLSRLAAAVQICDTGVCPGSGVGNARAEISRQTLGVPVIAIGVPTVVNVTTLLSDAFAACGMEPDRLSPEARRSLGEMIGEECYVAPKDCSSGIKSISRMVGYALNAAIHRNISYSEMRDFL